MENTTLLDIAEPNTQWSTNIDDTPPLERMVSKLPLLYFDRTQSDLPTNKEQIYLLSPTSNMGNNVSIDRDTPIKLHKLPLGDVDDIPYSNDITIDNFLQILSSIHKLTIMTNTEYESLFHNNPITKKTKTSLFTPP